MSAILVVMPPEWVVQDLNYIASHTGYDATWLASVVSYADLNQRLKDIGYFTEGENRQVVDSTVIADTLYFKFDIIRD